jgi:hypothetical protein
MPAPLVPDEFGVPVAFEGPGFRLEPLGPQHNERDHEAWMSSIDHIRATPGFGPSRGWPQAMDLDANRADLIGHARDFENREGFTYSILDGDEVIGCVYIYPSKDPGYDAAVSSWVRKNRAEMDAVVYRSLATWLAEVWPFENPEYAERDEDAYPGL